MTVSHFSRFRFLTIIQVLQCTFLIFHLFQCILPYSRSYHVSFSFSLLVSFLAIIQLLQCICLIFHVFTVSRHILGSKVSVSHFPSLLVFSPYSSSDSVCFSFFTFFKVLAIIPVLQCTFLIFHLFQCVLPYSTSYHVIFPFALFVSFLTIIQVLQCIFFIFHCFSPYPIFYSEYVSFYTFFRFLTIFQFLCFEFHIFVCHFSCHITDPTLCMSHFPRFSVFSPYARSYSVYLSFFMFLSISCHIPGPTM